MSPSVGEAAFETPLTGLPYQLPKALQQLSRTPPIGRRSFMNSGLQRRWCRRDMDTDHSIDVPISQSHLGLCNRCSDSLIGHPERDCPSSGTAASTSFESSAVIFLLDKIPLSARALVSDLLRFFHIVARRLCIALRKPPLFLIAF